MIIPAVEKTAGRAERPLAQGVHYEPIDAGLWLEFVTVCFGKTRFSPEFHRFQNRVMPPPRSSLAATSFPSDSRPRIIAGLGRSGTIGVGSVGENVKGRGFAGNMSKVRVVALAYKSDK
ncbi:MAG: hypothetical protein KGN39_09010 [Betaproteobacteria bacterium]|nr:hypothetical protein [Betaproteobacteria bacterium]